MSEAGGVPEPFADFARHRFAASFGMWLFLASEVIFFGGLFLGYAVYRVRFPEAFAIAGGHTDLRLGAANTAILLTSGATMAVAVWAGPARLKSTVLLGLGLTLALGVAFLGVKAYEYSVDFSEDLVPGRPAFPLNPPQTEIFFSFYWVMTGLHVAHVASGLIAVATIFMRVRAEAIPWAERGDLHAIGLYWALVDVIWIFLFPLLYLAGR